MMINTTYFINIRVYDFKSNLLIYTIFIFLILLNKIYI